MQTLSVDRIVGQTLGNYRVERLLGQGRLSAVYLAQSVLTGMHGALTLFIIPERFSNDARNRFMQRFRKEAEALIALQHPHLLSVHEYGEHQGYPYLVTPYMTNGSLADILKREGRCDHIYVLDILEQVVEGLEYAHRKGVIHGTLKPSNIVLGPDQKMLVAGFGLMHMLQMRGIERDDRPYGHLLSIADTFLAAPEYIAPEVVQGQSIDKRSDIYALGIILFELLSGKPPFTGTNALEVAKMHVQQSVPSLRALHPDIPVALASVINQALDRDPARRFQSTSELVEAFSQVSLGASGSMRKLDKMPKTSPLVADNTSETPADGYPAGNWQFMPPIVTGKLKTVNLPDDVADPSVQATEDGWQFMPPIVTGRLEAINVPAKTSPVAPEAPQESARSAPPPVRTRQPAPPTLIPPVAEPMVPVAPVPSVEPIVPAARIAANEQKKDEWWQPPSAQEPLILRSPEADPWNTVPGENPAWNRPASTARPPVRRSRKTGMGRRKVIALLATGGVVAAGALIGVKMNLGQAGTGTTAATNQQNATNTGNTAAAPQQGNLQGGNGNMKTQNQPVAPQTPSIASTAMPLNSARVFNNNKDLLIHLPNGNFVAYDRSCTHEGVFVNYNPGTKTIVCPAHGAVFNPMNGAVISGPAPTAIASVKIRVNANGTITMA